MFISFLSGIDPGRTGERERERRMARLLPSRMLESAHFREGLMNPKSYEDNEEEDRVPFPTTFPSFSSSSSSSSETLSSLSSIPTRSPPSSFKDPELQEEPSLLKSVLSRELVESPETKEERKRRPYGFGGGGSLTNPSLSSTSFPSTSTFKATATERERDEIEEVATTQGKRHRTYPTISRMCDMGKIQSFIVTLIGNCDIASLDSVWNSDLRDVESIHESMGNLVNPKGDLVDEGDSSVKEVLQTLITNAKLTSAITGMVAEIRSNYGADSIPGKMDIMDHMTNPKVLDHFAILCGMKIDDVRTTSGTAWARGTSEDIKLSKRREARLAYDSLIRGSSYF